MDGNRFDSLARALAGASRRRLLGAALAAALAPLAGPAQERRGSGVAGPCSPDPREERCAKDADCCTGLCNEEAGRCRCARAGQRCAEDRNCCARAAGGPLTCQGDAGAQTCRPAACPGGCEECERCRRGSCVPDPAKVGGLCAGDQVCSTTGECAACGPGNPCPDGRCCDAGTGACLVQGAACADGKVCRLGACVGNGFCGPGTERDFACGPNSCGAEIPDQDSRTWCQSTLEDGLVCLGRFFAGTEVAALPACESSADCGANAVCSDRGNSLEKRCFPLCGPRT